MSRLFDALQQSVDTPSEPGFSEALAVLREFGSPALAAAPVRSLDLPRNGGVRLLSATAPGSPGAERFRLLGTRLKQIKDVGKFKTLLITSCVRDEGKSLVAANLALSLASNQERVLLIDGDLRRPTLGNVFGVPATSGIAEWKNDGAVAELFYRVKGLPLWFLPAGAAPAQPLDVLNAPRVASLMAQIGDAFDWVLIDSPPLIPFADTTLWTAASDRVLLVVREGHTPRRLLKKAAEMIQKGKLLGSVVNDASDTEKTSYYGYRQSSPNPAGKAASQPVAMPAKSRK
jgi:capsular exopolysaccharide synthesis family protein